MKSLIFGLVAATLLVVSAAGQSTQVVVNNGLSGCPVAFSAGRSAGLTEFRDAGGKGGEISQSLNVQMSNTGSQAVVSAQLTIHGLTAKGHVAPASREASETKQVPLHLGVAAGKQAGTDVRVYGFTSVQRIDLDSIAYADGTTWNAPSNGRCSVVPSGFMLVAGH